MMMDAVIQIVIMAHWVKWANNKNKIYPTNIELYVNTCRCTMYASIHVLSMKLIQQIFFFNIFFIKIKPMKWLSV